MAWAGRLRPAQVGVFGSEAAPANRQVRRFYYRFSANAASTASTFSK
jgi:hypothetical protein